LLVKECQILIEMISIMSQPIVPHVGGFYVGLVNCVK